MVSKYFPDDGFCHSPFIKRSYCLLMVAALLLSGAGSYFQVVSNFSLTVLDFPGEADAFFFVAIGEGLRFERFDKFERFHRLAKCLMLVDYLYFIPFIGELFK